MQFFCAMCLAAAAIQAVVNPAAAGPSPPSAEATKALARRVGLEAGKHHQEGVQRALDLIAREARQPTGVAAGGANLVWDFASAIQPSVGPPSYEGAERRPWVVPAVREPVRARVTESSERQVELSLDAVDAGIRGLFAEQGTGVV